IFNPSIGFDETVSEPGGPGEFPITLFAATGYTTYVVSTTDSDDLCSGSVSNFPIVAGGTTIVFVNLTCVPRSALPAPALGRLGPWLALALASLGALALRARVRRLPRRR